MKKDKIIQGRTCADCLHYSQHYVKIRTRFQKVFCGNCTNADIKANIKPDSDICEHFKEADIAKDATKKLVKETLEYIENWLKEIATILKDDE